MLAAGLPATPANRSDDTSSSSSTSNTYQDRRNAVQGGIGTSGDGNTTNATIISTDQGAVQGGIAAAIAGINAAAASSATSGAVAVNAMGANGMVALNAINANGTVAANANSTMADVSKSVLTASSHLADVGLSMLQTNTALANSLSGGVNQATQAVTGIAQQLAQTQIAAQNDNRYLIAAGLAVVAIVGFAAFSKGHA